MKVWIKDTVGLGTGLWVFGYLISLVLFFSPFAGIMGWIITAVFTPVTIAITWWWFRARDLPLAYYAKVGFMWAVIAVVLDYLFIVQLFQATYYGPDVFVYYTLTFLIPVGVGLYLVWTQGEKVEKERCVPHGHFTLKLPYTFPTAFLSKHKKFVIYRLRSLLGRGFQTTVAPL